MQVYQIFACRDQVKHRVWKILTMKIALVLLASALFANATMIHDGDNDDSALVSHLLAKVQRLESRIMTRSNTLDNRPNIKSTKQTAKRVTRSIEPRSAPECKCPLSVVTYTRWGNSSCPYGTNTIYSGFAGGSHYTHEGAAVDLLCLPPDPQYLKSKAGYQNWGIVYGVEYETSGTQLDHSHDRNMPCAMCEAYGRTSKIMIPSHYECPPGWTREYYGYLMAGAHGHKAATQYTCVDESLEQIPGSGSSTDGKLFYTVEAHCGQFIPCSDKELTCVVCTK